MRALVYVANVEYPATSRWDAPSALWVTEEDVLAGVAHRECPDCGGTGRFPVPWREPKAAPEDYDLGDDSCVACKGTGLTLVSV